MFNILLNAIYASPEGGEIIIALYTAAGAFVIEVADEGSGMPEDVKLKIYEPFFTTKPIGEGTGLGLSVVHGIIKSHSGSITVHDNSPCGTIFRIELPLTQK